MEIKLIAYYDTTNRNKGYNITLGGESANGYRHTEETKEKIKENAINNPNYGMKGKCHSEETKEKIRKKTSGENHNMFGKTHSEETKEKMKKNGKGKNKGENNYWYGKGYLKEGENNYWYGKNRPEISERMKGKNNPRAKAIICITTLKIFDTSKEGAEYYNIKNKGDIGQCCRGKLNYCGKSKGVKLVWKFLEDFLNELLIIEL